MAGIKRTADVRQRMVFVAALLLAAAQDNAAKAEEHQKRRSFLPWRRRKARDLTKAHGAAALAYSQARELVQKALRGPL